MTTENKWMNRKMLNLSIMTTKWLLKIDEWIEKENIFLLWLKMTTEKGLMNR